MTLTVGQRLRLTIEDIAFGGEGVGRTDDFVVFVPFVAPGEVVEAEVIEVKKKFARARLMQVLEPSPDRVKAPCRYFGECGGCQYQHLAYAKQLQSKHKQIRDLFQRIGGFNPELIDPLIPCPQPYGYRNRLMIRSQWDKFKQGLNIGFIRADNRLVVDIEECLIAEPAINQQIKSVRAHPPPKGGIKVVLRILPEGWEVPRDSFFQNNFFLLPELVKVVRERLQLAATRHLLDVYCGVGFFSIELADLVESFTGVELDQLAIKAARRNAASRGRTNGEFIASAAEQILPQLITSGAGVPPAIGASRPRSNSGSQGAEGETPAPLLARATTVLLDPPRKGCRADLLETLRQAGCAQIIYVSCHPATMARDLNVLCRQDVFELVKVVPLDMFPQTGHVESVADLRCKLEPPEEA